MPTNPRAEPLRLRTGRVRPTQCDLPLSAIGILFLTTPAFSVSCVQVFSNSHRRKRHASHIQERLDCLVVGGRNCSRRRHRNLRPTDNRHVGIGIRLQDRRHLRSITALRRIKASRRSRNTNRCAHGRSRMHDWLFRCGFEFVTPVTSDNRKGLNVATPL